MVKAPKKTAVRGCSYISATLALERGEEMQMATFARFRQRATLGTVSFLASVIFTAGAPISTVCAQCEQAKLIASDAALSDNFGNSVAMDGDTAVVGVAMDDHAAGTDAGSAYVFVRAGGLWMQQAKLIASDAAASDNFGISVAVSGDTVVVGAYFDDHLAGINAGSAYVFTRSGTTWTEQTKLIASDAAANDNFGRSVAVSGDTSLVGSHNDDHAGGVDAGSAYVLIRAGAVWSEQAKLTTGAVANDKFGVSVAISGDTAVIGAYLSGPSDTGAAHFFDRSSGAWTYYGNVTALGVAANDFYGYSVALSGNTAVIGAWGDDHLPGPVVDAGSAYVFVRSGTSWMAEGVIVNPESSTNDRFGISVAAYGNTVVVGSYFDDNAGGTNAGSAFVYFDPVPGAQGNTWTQQAMLTAADPNFGANFGHSVAMSGNTILVGADSDLHAGGLVGAGSAYVFADDCDADDDGVPNLIDVCSNTPPGLPVCANGRPQRDCNNDCLVDGLDVECFVAELLGL